MYKQCVSARSVQRQRELEQGLLRAMQRRHYDQITVSDLCQELDIPRKAFYRYFSGKEGALYALIDHTLMDYDRYEQRENTGKHLTPLQYMEQVCGYWIHCKPLLDALARSNMSGVLIQRAIDYTKNLKEIPQFMMTQDKQQQDYGAMFATCGIMSMIVQWHHDGYSQSVEQMASLLVRLLSQPLFVIDLP